MDEGRPFPLPAREASGLASRGQLLAAPEIRHLVAGAKALRRELQAMRVRAWKDEDRIAELGAALQEALGRLREREAELASMRFGGGRFFERGFRLGEGAAIAGNTVRRRKSTPSGTMIFGPYVRLAPGCYGARVAARLYERLPVCAQFTAEAVCEGGHRCLAARRFRVWALPYARHCEFVFSVPEGLHRDDFELRIWTRRGAPLEVSGVEVYPLDIAALPLALPAPVPSGAAP